MPAGISCRGLLYEVAPGRELISPGAGFIHVGYDLGRSFVVITTDIPLEVTIAGNFDLKLKQDGFILHGEPLGRMQSSRSAFVCLEARKCDGTIVDPRPWMNRSVGLH